ncbi:MAG: type I-C CRISPR-associated protein Cas5c [Oscillospiraceae bacterium]|nr:type I-C CRISPR-associated protein Cas5c [Oscillospiraceae bacterium]
MFEGVLRKKLKKYLTKFGGNDLAYHTYLCDVRYQVRAYFEWNDNRPKLAGDRNENKHHSIGKRMIERGGRRTPTLGCSECFAYVQPCVFGEGKGAYDELDEISFGLCYHGITYADEAVLPEDKGKMILRLWQPVMKKGVIKFVQPEDIPPEMKRHIRDMEIKPFGKDTNNFSELDEFEGVMRFELGNRAVRRL